MTPHAPLSVSDDFARLRRERGTATPFSEGADNRELQRETLCGRLSQIADALRQTSGHTPQPAAIDRLLHAIGEQDGYLSRNAKGQAGDIAVAIDSIIRWIGNAENRFASLAKTSIRTQQRMERIASLVETQKQVMHKQAITVRDKLGAAEQAISSLERKLGHIEHPTTENRPGRVNQQITDLTRNLHLHYRLMTHNTACSTRYFELTTRQIESFAQELRQFRAETEETKRKTALLPLMAEKLDRLTEEREAAAEMQTTPEIEQREQPALEAVAEKLDQTIDKLENETGAARSAHQTMQTDMEMLHQRIQQLEELGHSMISEKADAPPASNPPPAAGGPGVSSGGTRIRGEFIAAARQAMRHQQHPQQEGSDPQAGGTRFLRTAGTRGF